MMQDNTNKKVIIKNCVPFTDCIKEINNTQIDNVKDIDVVMPIYHLTEQSLNYLRTSGCLWQYYRNGLALNNSGTLIDFTDASNNSALFIFRQGITGQVGNDGTKDVEIMVPLKYLNHFGELVKCL